MGHHKNNSLTARQQMFVQEYLVDLNAKQAAIRAGYSAKTAEVQGSRLLSKAKVQEAVAGAMTAREERTQVDQDFVIKTVVETILRCRGEDGHDFNPNAVLRGTEQLGKHLGMFVSRHELTGSKGGPLEITKSVVERIWAENENAKTEE